MASFGVRQQALEGSYIREQEYLLLQRRAEKLGLKDSHQLRSHGLPTSFASRAACESVPRYVKGPQSFAPPPSAASEWGRVCEGASFGRGRWTSHDASIFSVAEGAQMAQTPPRQMTQFEQLRHNKITRAMKESPLLANRLRLMPEYTPGRALLWGSVLALWGSGAIFMTAARNLDIHTVDEAEGKIGAVVRPIRNALQGFMLPLRQALPSVAPGEILPNDLTELAQRMKAKLGR